MAQLTFANPSSHLNVNLSYERELSSIKLSPNDSLLVVGKTKDLKNIKSSDIAALLKDLSVQESWFDESIDYLCKKSGSGDKDSKPTSGVSWLNKLVIETISSKCSRSNTPTGGHKLAKIVHRNTYGSQKQAIVVVCEHAHAVASAAAVARSFPLFSAKTSKNDPTKPRVVQVFFIFPGQSGQPHSYASQEEVECFSILARSIRLTARITDTPCADMTTTHFLDEIKLVANELGLVPTVIEGEELNKRGFGGLYNVGKAAINSPKLVVLSNIKEASKKTFAWVGKGIVYDTGGLCIKSRTGMCSMKRDCGGAAGILGAFYAAVKMGFSDNLHAVFCLAENAVGPISYRPDDIIKLYSGKTVEVTNTDAEGRLVLGDGVAYARKDLKADVIVDMATLTGGQGPATGRLHAAVVTNSEQWERACVDVGRKCGDLVHPLIYAPELLIHEFRSEVADMTNSVKNRDNATSSCAGHFIHAHLGSNFKGVWVHLDIASPVEESDRATGYGVTLLTSLFSKSIQNSAYKLITPESELPITAECEEDDEQNSYSLQSLN